MFSLSRRVLTLLQFTRMALVFTAISNGWAAMLLQADMIGVQLTVPYAIAMTVVSIGLYTFGMALNDLIDRRRDSQIASHRPLPSGRISVHAAHLVCTLLGLLAIGGAIALVLLRPEPAIGSRDWLSLALVFWTLGLIVFYDFAGKYLVALGLLSLGLIRFFHATIAAPTLVIPWHAIVLLLHVTILSTVCYALEGKRPRLTRGHYATVIGGLVLIVGMLIVFLLERRLPIDRNWQAALRVTDALIYPGVAVAAFVGVAVLIRLQHPDPRSAGRTMMLYGLLWLIIYDAAFVLGYVGWKYSLVILSLFPIALLAVQVMRWWTKLVELSTRPEYQRAR